MSELETRLSSLRATRSGAIDALHLPQSAETANRLRANITMLDGCIAELEAQQMVEQVSCPKHSTGGGPCYCEREGVE